MTDADSVVGLLHLAQAAAAAYIQGEWADEVQDWVNASHADTMDEHVEFAKHASPSVVVALLERLQRAEAAADELRAIAQEARYCEGLQQWWGTGDDATERMIRLDAALAAWRGVTGLQEPAKETK